MSRRAVRFDEPLSPAHSRLDLDAGREAPLVGAHLLTHTPLSAPLPPIAFRLATTRGTNALLEGRGAKVALFITAGFGDLLRIGDQTRPNLFALNIVRPEPLHAAVVEVSGRQDKDGNLLHEIDFESIQEEAKRLLADGIDTACVALLHSYRNPEPERAVAALLREMGFALVITSTELSSRIHFGRRTETALINAYLAPLMEAYLSDVRGRLHPDSTLRIMTSAGGLVSRERFRPIDSLLSGPAGGVVGAVSIGHQLGLQKILAFDMGGTSTDVSRYDGHYHYQRELRIGQARLQSDALHIETVAAGGGSICSVERSSLKVGPESAGASPGPACYGAGGPLTLTDVHALLGRLSTETFAIPLDLQAAKDRWATFLDENDLSPDQTPAYLAGFLQIANERMADAIRSISVREGEDPSEYALLAFGGAGGLHACALADLLGITEVIVPQDAGILSARGLQQATLEAQRDRQVLMLWDEAAAKVGPWSEEMADHALEEIGLESSACDIRIEGELRFVGQEATLTVSLKSDATETFLRDYQRIFGHAPDRKIEIESIRVRVREHALSFESEVFVEKDVLSGPLLVPDPHGSLMIEPGWEAERGTLGTLRLRSNKPTDTEDASHPPEVLLELFTQRFRHVVQSMGDQLKKTALSTNVKERMDYSCCLLDARGQLIANAPHIPVHLGAMGICVRRVMETLPTRDGDVILTNHPAYGGSHLPDLTVIMPVFHQGELFGFVANRAHHAEIGGIRPGSMPPDATCLEEEGILIPPMHLFEKGQSCEDAVKAHLLDNAHPTRAIEENLADLSAQVASCRTGAHLLIQLLDKHGTAIVSDQLGLLYQCAADCSLASLREHLPAPVAVIESLDDGSEIHLQLTPSEDRITIDFAGTTRRHPANLNATPAIVHSALIYVIRLLQTRDLPLNEGLLDGVSIHLPTCFLNPDFDAKPSPPVVGGNVESSQRLVDTLLKAFDIVACSQGTMNNLIFGNDTVSYYETICGGAGAGPDFHGACAVHTHMTNTAITDPEILEWRYPVRLWRFAIRQGSGGQGQHRGGDGVIREFEFLAPLAVSLLTQHRKTGPYGRHGGQDGKPGSQHLIHNGCETTLESLASFDSKPGDRLIIKTPGGGAWGTK
ncbi:MAG: 5-oxoprolinase (ATP-hydrolyzing) [Verrucomicrobiales bacterium]